MRLAMVGVREIDLMTASLPRSMRLAIATFALAREQRDGAHLAQVHAHRIVGLVECARGEIELGPSSLPSRSKSFSARYALSESTDLDPALPNALNSSSRSSAEVISEGASR
jgi:hypothetical protein